MYIGLTVDPAALANVATDVESNIKEIMDLLEEEDRREAEFQVITH